MADSTQLVTLLDHSSPEELDNDEALREAFRKYFRRGNPRTQKIIKSLMGSKSYARTGQSKAQAYFTERRKQTAVDRRKRRAPDEIARLLKAVEQLQASAKLSAEDFPSVWRQQWQLADCEEGISPHKRLVQGLHSLENTEQSNECAWRIVRMFIHHEVESLLPLNHRGQDIATAAERLGTSSGCSKDDILRYRSDARPYMELAKLGLGTIIMAGSQRREMWRRLTNDDVALLIAYTRDNLPDVMSTVTALNPVAEGIIRDGLAAYGSDVGLLQLRNTTFSKLYLREQVCAPEDSLAAISTAVANQSSSQYQTNLDWPYTWLAPACEFSLEHTFWNLDATAGATVV